MKLTLLIATLFCSSAFAIRAPTGLHKTLSCTAQGINKFNVYIEKHTAQPKFAQIVIVTLDGVEKKFPGVEKVLTRVGAPVEYSAAAPGGRLTVSISFSNAPVRPGMRAGKIVSQAYGIVTTTALVCSRIMY